MIEVKNLTKSYGPVVAVNNVSFTAEKGHVYGFLGPNGAGKSTTMNMICGCLAPTEGEVTIGGFDIIEDAVEAKRHIGYLPEIPPLYPDMTPFEMLEFVGRAKKLKGAELYDEIEEVMEMTGTIDVADRLIKNLSKGYKQRVGIAVALMGDPEVIILDEPTVGLDPIQIMEIRDLIRELGKDHTVILSSHILQEIAAVCDYVIMISKGCIVEADTLDNLLGNAEDKNAALEQAFIRLAGESLDAGAAYAMEKEAAKKEKLEEKAARRSGRKVKVASKKGAAYYEEEYVENEDESEDEYSYEEESEDEDEEYTPLFKSSKNSQKKGGKRK
ncbi:MAG: ABC transporter ATP-binding protein [Clostridia bacterium]|nr:ABC transporter ATP-binding protein [Clostridia bacterium]